METVLGSQLNRQGGQYIEIEVRVEWGNKDQVGP